MEAAKMVGVSAPTFRKLLDKYPELPGTVLEEIENGREIKKYTLSAINFLRSSAVTRYIRPVGSNTLIIAVSNLKGRVGKTETAVDLGKKIGIPSKLSGSWLFLAQSRF
jgi:chromosome partitioning protein